MYDFDLPSQSWITADNAYTDYDGEDAINEAGLHMKPMRKSNSKRLFPPWVFYMQSTIRKIVETTGSLIERLLPESIHSVRLEGFELKAGLFVWLPVSISFGSYLG